MKPQIRTHRDLRAWQEAMNLAERVYRVTEGFPDAERFGLSQQMRRASVSVISNIAEGAARNSSREFAQFLGVARGSLAELESQLELAVRLSFVKDPNQVGALCATCGRMLTALLLSIRRNFSD